MTHYYAAKKDMQRVAIVSIHDIKIDLLEPKEINYWTKLTAEMR